MYPNRLLGVIVLSGLLPVVSIAGTNVYLQADVADPIQLKSANRTLARVGTGWDSELDRSRRACVQLKNGEVVPQRGENISVRRSLTTFSSATRIIEHYSQSVNAAYNGVEGSGSAGFQRARQGEFSNYENYAALVNTVEYNPPRGLPLSSFELTQEAKSRLDSPEGYASFVAVCGDSFVSTILEGGLYDARLEISSNTAAIQASTRRQIEGAAFSGSMSADTRELFEEFSEENRLHFEEYATTERTLNDSRNSTFEDMLFKWENFPSAVRAATEKPVIGYVTESYEPLILEYLSDGRARPPIPQWVVDVRANFSYMQRLMRLRGDAIYIRQNSSEFVPHDRQKIQNAIVNLEQEIERVRVWGLNCINEQGCDQASKPTIHQLPPPPDRVVQPWKVFDPRTFAEQLVGRTGDIAGRLELRGQFYIANDGRTAPVTWSWAQVTLKPLRGGRNRVIKPPVTVVDVPPFTDVYWNIHTEDWIQDNRLFKDRARQARGRVGEILDLDRWDD